MNEETFRCMIDYVNIKFLCFRLAEVFYHEDEKYYTKKFYD